MKQETDLRVCLDEQRLEVVEDGKVNRSYIISTALRGMGEREGSLRTPRGRFRISEKIGDGEPMYTIFKSRQPVGIWEEGMGEDGDLILTRILRLEGMEADNINTHQRCIYIHGTNQETLLGQAVSHGCVRLSNADMLDLFEYVEVGTTLSIEPYQSRDHQLLFVDFDVLLTKGFAIDYLESVIGGRMDCLSFIRPSYDDFIRAGHLCQRYLSSETRAWVDQIREQGWKIVIYSSCPLPIIEFGLDGIEVDGIEGERVYFDENGKFDTCENKWVLAGNAALLEVIADWSSALPSKTRKMIEIHHRNEQKTLIIKDYSLIGSEGRGCESKDIIVGNRLDLLGGEWFSAC